MSRNTSLCTLSAIALAASLLLGAGSAAQARPGVTAPNDCPRCTCTSQCFKHEDRQGFPALGQLRAPSSGETQGKDGDDNQAPDPDDSTKNWRDYINGDVRPKIPPKDGS